MKARRPRSFELDGNIYNSKPTQLALEIYSKIEDVREFIEPRIHGKGGRHRPGMATICRMTF